MDIKVKQVAPNVYSVEMGETKIALDAEEVKALMLQLSRVMTPAMSKPKNRTAAYKEFLIKIRTANNIGIQGLLTAVASEHLLVLFKLCEKDKVLTNIFFKNMSDNSAKMLREDLSYRFPDELPKNLIEPAMERVLHEARHLEVNGTLVYPDAKKNKA
ncbi:MAG: hypothetical protein OQJ97_08350 [Rhodospirillales bacterium]|nr:hypothetical protein [Rhodospirillales bacterium]